MKKIKKFISLLMAVVMIVGTLQIPMSTYAESSEALVNLAREDGVIVTGTESAYNLSAVNNGVIDLPDPSAHIYQGAVNSYPAPEGTILAKTNPWVELNLGGDKKNIRKIVVTVPSDAGFSFICKIWAKNSTDTDYKLWGKQQVTTNANGENTSFILEFETLKTFDSVIVALAYPGQGTAAWPLLSEVEIWQENSETITTIADVAISNEFYINAVAESQETVSESGSASNAIGGTSGIWHTDYDEIQTVAVERTEGEIYGNNNIYLTLSEASEVSKLTYLGKNTNGSIDNCNVYVTSVDNPQESDWTFVSNFVVESTSDSEPVDWAFDEVQTGVTQIKIEVLHTIGGDPWQRCRFISGYDLSVYDGDETKLSVTGATCEAQAQSGYEIGNLVDVNEDGSIKSGTQFHTLWDHDSFTVKFNPNNSYKTGTNAFYFTVTEPQDVTKFASLKRSNGGNGNIYRANVYMVTADAMPDGAADANSLSKEEYQSIDWGEPVISSPITDHTNNLSGTAENWQYDSANRASFEFDTAIQDVKYVKIEVLHGNGNFISADEFELYTEEMATVVTPWKVTYVNNGNGIEISEEDLAKINTLTNLEISVVYKFNEPNVKSPQALFTLANDDGSEYLTIWHSPKNASNNGAFSYSYPNSATGLFWSRNGSVVNNSDWIKTTIALSATKKLTYSKNGSGIDSHGINENAWGTSMLTGENTYTKVLVGKKSTNANYTNVLSNTPVTDLNGLVKSITISGVGMDTVAKTTEENNVVTDCSKAEYLTKLEECNALNLNDYAASTWNAYETAKNAVTSSVSVDSAKDWQLYNAVDDLDEALSLLKKGDITQYSISLKGDVAMNFYTNIAANVDKTTDNTYVEFTVNDGTTDVTQKVYAREAEIRSDGSYVFSCSLTAKQMSDAVTAKLVVDEVECDTATAAIKDYATAQLSADVSDSLKTLLKAMLNYGAKAQMQFGYRTDMLANGGLAEEDQTISVETIEGSVFTKGDNTIDGLAYAGTSTLLKSKTNLRHYFTYTGDVTTLNVECTTDSSVTPTIETETTTNGTVRYFVLINNISAKDLKTEYGIRITDAEGNTMDITANVYAYLAGALKVNQATDVVKAMYLYGEAAATYFTE